MGWSLIINSGTKGLRLCNKGDVGSGAVWESVKTGHFARNTNLSNEQEDLVTYTPGKGSKLIVLVPKASKMAVPTGDH